MIQTSLTGPVSLENPNSYVVFFISGVGSNVKNQHWENVKVGRRWGSLIYELWIGQKWVQALTLGFGFPI